MMRSWTDVVGLVCEGLLLVHLPGVVDVLAHHLNSLRPGGVFIAVDYDGNVFDKLINRDSGVLTAVGAQRKTLRQRAAAGVRVWMITIRWKPSLVI
jgi:hypothetical protein